jgi:hypothetical protein
VNGVAVAVGEDLHLDVPGAFDVLFEVDAAVLERLGGLLPRGRQAGPEGIVVAGDPHAAAAAARRRFDEHRVADLLRQRDRFGVLLDEPFTAGDDRHAGLLGELAGVVLVAELAHRLLGRADELDVAGAADFGEVRVLAEKTVAGVDRLHVGDFRGGDDTGNVEITFRRGRGADADGFVGKAEIGGVAVGGAEDGDRFDAEVVASADDPQGDFSAVRD